MNRDQERAATTGEIRRIIGPCDDDLVIKIVDLRATPSDMLEAHLSPVYSHHRLHQSLHGGTAEVCDILESELPERDRL